MKKILLTGGTGFIGRNILPILQEKYDVFAPNRAELNVNDQKSIDMWLDKNDVDILVHCAIVNPAKTEDRNRNVLNDTLKSFLCFNRHAFEKIVYIGSGAEYDKSSDIIDVSEEDIGKNIPTDEYGLAKYALNEIARSSENIINLRIFGCYGPAEPERRFIRHAIECCLKSEPVSIRQDCQFSYVYVKDLGQAVLRVLETTTKFRDYNICSDFSYKLSDLAEIVKKQMRNFLATNVLTPGLNKAYTGKNSRFKNEFPDFEFTPIEQGIAEQIVWQRSL
ncbi:MAG: NAD-dependent epimerase/dehydratase family protein [Alphaproteobacteria bacterium]